MPSSCHLSRRVRPSRPTIVKRGRRHPLKAGVNQYVYRVFGTVMYHAAFVDLADSAGCRIHQMHVGQVKRWQILVVKGRSFTTIGIVGF